MQMVSIKDEKIYSSFQKSRVALLKYAKKSVCQNLVANVRRSCLNSYLINAKSNQIFPGAFAIKHRIVRGARYVTDFDR